MRWYEMLDSLRRAGWLVAVHNDYVLATDQGGVDQVNTFWLFTNKQLSMFVRGEGHSDEIAVMSCVEQIQEIEQKRLLAKISGP